MAFTHSGHFPLFLADDGTQTTLAGSLTEDVLMPGPDPFSPALLQLTSASAALGFSTETMPFFRDDVTSMFGPAAEERARTGIVSQQASGCPVGEWEWRRASWGWGWGGGRGAGL